MSASNLAFAVEVFGPSPHEIGAAAVLALHDELALSPKPGLVTLTSTGSHDDMDARTFLRSMAALRGYFIEMAGLGASGADFPALQRRGLQAEADMLAATGGINTHRGAIFQLGLLCAAAGALAGEGVALSAAGLRATLLQRWGAALADRSLRPSTLPGGIAARALGLRSASQEAAQGFPVVFETAAPALQRALQRGLDVQSARLDTLFHIIAVLDDSNLAHRGGADGLRFAQRAARGLLRAGGIQAPHGLRRALTVGAAFEARRLSPGGAADMLASACWLHRLGALPPP
jgi:triphosphoribosyl-dephospho-CoA synthase